MKKKLALILALVMMLTAVPVGVFGLDEAAAVANGWSTDHISYYENGSAVRDDVRAIDGALYYFDAIGDLSTFTGWKTTASGTYWANASGTIASSPVRIGGSKVVKKKVKWKKVRRKWKYKKKRVTVATNDLYMFGTDGRLITTKGVFSYNGNEYYGLGGGVLKTGWAASGNHAMYFKKTDGSMAKNTTIGHLKVPKSGRLGKAYALGVKQLNKSGWSLRKAYKFSYRLRYKSRWYRRKTAEDYAIRGFTKKNGNCYVMASTFYIQAKLLGYDIHQVKGKVNHRAPHSWTVIRQGGRDWVYDPNFRNETGRNGWKIYYGKKGTWRYTDYHKMN